MVTGIEERNSASPSPKLYGAGINPESGSHIGIYVAHGETDGRGYKEAAPSTGKELGWEGVLMCYLP